MASTTTLMTFRVRTPPTTRRVELYGSWDNFSMPYPMRRDERLGVEHWSGCHSFENIICDGRVYGFAGSRRGGLKMGGTYWYYYKLDDDIEFHNSAEPSTTACPMLPGQLVNVLQVPVALSGSRNRGDSVDSTSSEQHTMNPEARFMNPRPSPAPPTTCRLNTSPNLPSLSFSAATSPTSTSQPSLSRCSSRDNLHISNMHRLPRMASQESFNRVGRLANKSTGLRQAFKTFRTGRSQSPDAQYKHIVEWAPAFDGKIAKSAPQTPEYESDATSYFESATRDEPCRPSRGLLLRSSSDNSIPTLSFLEHRRERSRSGSRGPSSLRNSLVLENPGRTDQETALVQRGVLDTLVEVVSPLCSAAPPPLPIYEPSAEHAGTPMQVDKRLPTLPNTPSSAYPPTASYSPRRGLAEQLAILSSRFSATTINTESHPDNTHAANQSRFSEWSTASSDLASSSSDSSIGDLVSSPATETGGHTPFIRLASQRNSHPDYSHSFDDGYEIDFVSSTGCTSTNSAMSSRSPSPDGNNKMKGSHSGFMHYQLPGSDFASETTLKSTELNKNEDQSLSVSDRLQSRWQSESLRDRRSGFPHSQSMQELMDELSYLSDAIIHH